MDTDKKKYKQMENILNKIHQKYISLPEYETKINNIILEEVTERLICLMRNADILFKNMYERKFYGGSFYDKIKVGKPEEYDLDFVLNLPLIIEPVLEKSIKPGFVYVHIMEYQKLQRRKEAQKFENLGTLLDDRIEGKKYLSTFKVLQWMERTIHLALNELKKENNEYYWDLTLNSNQDTNKTIRIYAVVSKSHPAFTLKLRSKDNVISMCIDLVPCFQFTDKNWPKESGYRQNPFPSKNKFLIVPKKPHMEDNDLLPRYWRLSFQEQERELITGDKFISLKPTIKLLKKLRDKQNHTKIASYYIKTIFLWEAEQQTMEFWKLPQSYVFMTMLKKYADMIQAKNIPYYWNKNHNLIDHLKVTTLDGIGKTLKNIVDDVENHLEDPFVIAHYLINQDQVQVLKNEVDLGKKYTKMKLLNIPKASDSLGLKHFISEEERIRRLVLNKDFLEEVSDHIARYLDSRLSYIEESPCSNVHCFNYCGNKEKQ